MDKNTKKKIPIIVALLTVISMTVSVVFAQNFADGDVCLARTYSVSQTQYMDGLDLNNAISQFKYSKNVDSKKLEAYEKLKSFISNGGDTEPEADETEPAEDPVVEIETEPVPSENLHVHEWTEANYQQPATCKGCGETSGTVLTPDFEKKGITSFAKLYVEYPYLTRCSQNDDLTEGKIVFTDYSVFDSDEKHEGLEGYEWRAVTVTATFEDVNALFSGYSLKSFDTDYYDTRAWAESHEEKGKDFTVSYNGVDYTECRSRSSMLVNRWIYHVGTYSFRVYQRVPIGYDGAVIVCYNSMNAEDGKQEWECVDENSVFFRMSEPATVEETKQETETVIPENVKEVVINSRNFPDKYFRNYVSMAIDDGDGVLSPEEILAVKEINISSNDEEEDKYTPTNLTGINYFINLESLDCSFTRVSKLSLTTNTALKSIKCQNANLSSIDITKCVALRLLDCSYNSLQKLDISKNTELVDLNCSANDIKALDTSNNLRLAMLDCSHNDITKLNLSQNINLGEIRCSENKLHKLDVSANTGLRTLGCEYNYLSSLDLTNNLLLKTVVCDGNRLSKLFVNGCERLESISCYDNRISELDVSTNIMLSSLVCFDNVLTELNVTNNVNLTELWCRNNKFRTLDISSNRKLGDADFSCDDKVTVIK